MIKIIITFLLANFIAFASGVDEEIIKDLDFFLNLEIIEQEEITIEELSEEEFEKELKKQGERDE